MATFEQHAELVLTATLHCGNCVAALEIEQTFVSGEETDKDSAQKLRVQAELEHWKVCDLNGKLDGECPVCDDCLRNER